MDFIRKINNYNPKNEQEIQDKKVIVNCIKLFLDNILRRDNEIAHITSSGFILNESLSKTLMVHHKIRDTRAWTGGHADGNPNLLEVAVKEAIEETGIGVTPISETIASLDVLTSSGHTRKGKYVNGHLHLSVAYLFIANEKDTLIVNPDENNDVALV